MVNSKRKRNKVVKMPHNVLSNLDQDYLEKAELAYQLKKSIDDLVSCLDSHEPSKRVQVMSRIIHFLTNPKVISEMVDMILDKSPEIDKKKTKEIVKRYL